MHQAPHILSIDTAALASNHALLKRLCPEAGACLKADAYGLGLAAAAPVLDAQGCRSYFVATVAEGVALRAFTSQTIYVFAGPRGGDAGEAAAHALVPVLNSLEDIALYGQGPCAVFLDTGMNRLGLDADEAAQLAENPGLLAGREVLLFLSHFAAADTHDHPLNALQTERFAGVRARLAPLFPAARWSLCNSAGIFHFPHAHYDLTRPGYALYGGNPTPGSPNPMRPTVSLQARVLQTRRVRAGESVGYDATHVFSAPDETATLCIGYADGFLRSLSGRAAVYWMGRPCPVLGRISMDLTSIGIGHLPEPRPRPGDMIEILGPHQDIDALAAAAGTIGYEILTSLGARYERRYISLP